MPGTMLGTANIDVKDLGCQAVLPHSSCEEEEEAKVEEDKGEEASSAKPCSHTQCHLRGRGPGLGAQASVDSHSEAKGEAATADNVTLHPAGASPKPWHVPLPVPEVQR